MNFDLPIFYQQLYQWYDVNYRDLPWRKTKNPYLIWVSEVILQQTQVKQGLPYYHRFIEAFPTVVELANSSEDDVLAQWKGLGYYSRARNMHHAAIYVCDFLGGNFPSDYKTLLMLKGVGGYTAAAVASFSANEAVGVLDGNVFRFYGRLFGIADPINSPIGIKRFKSLVDTLIDVDDPSKYNQAVMEFGALHCTQASPKCELCCFVTYCVAFTDGIVEQLPVKISAKTKQLRSLNYVLVCSDSSFLIEKRGEKDIWQGLYQLPLCSGSISHTWLEDWLSSFKPSLWNIVTKYSNIENLGSVQHTLSHQQLTISFYRVNISNTMLMELANQNLSYQLLSFKDIETIAFPVPIYRFLQSIFSNEIR